MDGSIVSAASTTFNSVRHDGSNHYGFDPRNLEIKTKSVEQTLVPLVTQVISGFIVNFSKIL